MGYYMQRIDDRLHEKMKQLQKQKNTASVTEEYRQAIEMWVAQESQNILLADTQILSRMEERLTKTENRLAKMNGRMGMDVAVSMVALLNLLAQKHGVTEQHIYDELRPIAATHFSKSKKDFL